MFYRTTDMAKWGLGTGVRLLKEQIDQNFWDIIVRLVALEENPPEPNDISNITLTGTQLRVFLGDGTVFGPFTIPVAVFHFRGDWLPAEDYFELDLFRVDGQGLFMVLHEHTSAGTFNPAAAGGSGALYLHILPDGANDLLALTDTPSSYTGHAGKVLSVKLDETGMEFLAQPYEIGGYQEAAPTSSQLMMRHLATRAVAFAINMVGSQAHAQTAATASTVFDVQKNGASVGTLTFAAAGTVGTFAAASAFSINAGDRLDLISPATSDATLAGISWTLVGTR